MIVAGVGCRSGVTVQAVLQAIDAAMLAHGLVTAKIDMLATAPLKAHELAIRDAALHLSLDLRVVTQGELDAAAANTLTSSPVSLKHSASPSVSEASALAAAGSGAYLLGPRLIHGDITVAFAISGEQQ
jgi:cobalt-precorrin 5A hydrolase